MVGVSENGWAPARVGADSTNWITVPGTSVTLQIQKGQPTAILRAAAADFNAYIEPLRDADSACWTPTNKVATSNHLNGTACDWNWNSHPFRVEGTFSTDQMRTLREMLEFYTQDGLHILFWAGDWKSPIDEMHWQMGYGTHGDDRVQKFIDTKIRADGYSTFRRGGGLAHLSKADIYALAIIGEGKRRKISAKGIRIALAVALVESNLKMYANRSVPASMNIPHDAVGSDHDSVGLFQQRSPMWGPPHILMDPVKSAGLFYDRLVKQPYNTNAYSPGYYAQAVQRSAFPERYDQRFPEAVEIYNRLVTSAPPGEDAGDGFMSALSPEEQRALYNEVMSRASSRSPLRHVHEGVKWSPRDMTYNTDGSVHVLVTYLCAVLLGDPDSIALLREVAANNEPDRVHDKRLAQAMLNVIAKQKTTASAPRLGNTIGTTEAPPVAALEPPAPPPVVVAPQPVESPVEYVPPVESSSVGQDIGEAYDSLKQLGLADALPPEEQAPLSALIAVLQTKNDEGIKK